MAISLTDRQLPLTVGRVAKVRFLGGTIRMMRTKAILAGCLLALTTGRTGSYNLNGFVQYDSNGKSFKSPETSFQIKVE